MRIVSEGGGVNKFQRRLFEKYVVWFPEKTNAPKRNPWVMKRNKN